MPKRRVPTQDRTARRVATVTVHMSCLLDMTSGDVSWAMRDDNPSEPALSQAFRLRIAGAWRARALRLDVSTWRRASPNPSTNCVRSLRPADTPTLFLSANIDGTGPDAATRHDQPCLVTRARAWVTCRPSSTEDLPASKATNLEGARHVMTARLARSARLGILRHARSSRLQPSRLDCLRLTSTHATGQRDRTGRLVTSDNDSASRCHAPSGGRQAAQVLLTELDTTERLSGRHVALRHA